MSDTSKDGLTTGLFRKRVLTNDRRGEEPIPRQASLYFNHLCSEYYILHGEGISPTHAARLEAIIKKKHERQFLSWHDLYTFELALVHSIPENNLPAKVRFYRTRFREIAGERPYGRYVASGPPEPTAASAEQLRSDLEYLVGEVHFRLAMVPVRERNRERLSRRIVSQLVLVLGLFVLLASLADIAGERFAPALVASMLAGAMGGLVSKQERYNRWRPGADPMFNVAQLQQGRFLASWPLLAGAIFAALLFLMCASDLLSGQAFPKIQGALGSTEYRFTPLGSLLHAQPTSYDQFGKLLVWSFLAGFAERLVPAKLSKLAMPKAGPPPRPSV